MSQNSNPVAIIALYAILIVMVVLRRRVRRHPANASLGPKERLRPLLITWLDPVIGFVFVGTILWRFANIDVAHLAAMIVGACCGIPIGVARANVQFVRAVPDAHSVVFRRSAL